jgi:hypothetical protein
MAGGCRARDSLSPNLAAIAVVKLVPPESPFEVEGVFVTSVIIPANDEESPRS